MRVLALVLAAGAAAVLLWEAAPRRLPAPSATAPPPAGPPPSRDRVLRLVAAMAGVGCWLLLGGVRGALAGAGASYLLARWLPSLETAATRRRRDELTRDVPMAMRLLAVCLDAGTSLDRACDVVADALGDPLAPELRTLGASLRLGTPVRRDATAGAWDTVLHLVQRSSTSGIAVSAALEVAAREARAATAAAAEAAARRAGVLVVVPLGVCFLPAFVLVGVVPLVYGIVLELLAGW